MMTLELMDNVGLIQDRINRLLSDVMETADSPAPALNVWQSDDKLTVTSELPGIDVKNVDITVRDNTLTLSGRFGDPSQEGEPWIRKERGSGEFSRELELPFRIQEDKVKARYSRGVLQIELPRAEADSPKRIAIKIE
jgi:HSP20 family protein